MKDFINNTTLKPELAQAITDMGFTAPTPIQEAVIPSMLEGKDILAMAPTGTGKTCAFGIPLMNKVEPNGDIQAIILCPTRELVLQTTEELNKLSKHLGGVKTLAIFGGQSMERQLFGIRKRPQIIVGTTGRVMDHLRRRTLNLEKLTMLILDEADEMLNMGFREDIDFVLTKVPKVRQTVMFSATMPKEIVSISKLYQSDPMTIKTTHEESELPSITQNCIITTEAGKYSHLTAILGSNNFKQVLIFCNMKKRVDQLAANLLDAGHSVEALHGDMRQRDRDNIMRKYRSGETSILVATDVAARGIDVDNIEAVINYDVPNDNEYYVHRIGRTARAGKSGVSYLLATADQQFTIRAFERYTKTKINIMDSTVDRKSIDDNRIKPILAKMANRQDAIKAYLTVQLDEYNLQSDKQYSYLDLAAAMFATSPATIDPMPTQKQRQARQQQQPSTPRTPRPTPPQNKAKSYYNNKK